MNEMARAKKSFFNKAIILFLLLFLVFRGVLYAAEKDYIALPGNVYNVVSMFLTIALTLIIINGVIRLTVDRVFNMFKKEMEIEQRIFITKLYSVFIYSIGGAYILYETGVQTTEITIFLGLITTGVAFAIRDIILSFFAWLIILTKRPFRIGHVVSTSDDFGVVERIGTFFVTLKTSQNFLVKVPNKNFLDKNTKNYGKNNISGALRLPVKTYSKDMQTKLNKMKKEGFEVYIDSDGKDFFLDINYSTEFGSENETRSNIIKSLQKKYPEIFISKPVEKNLN
ncbi:MAG: mechanosensitive ion channel family protein [Nanoarchaeota archaeon]